MSLLRAAAWTRNVLKSLLLWMILWFYTFIRGFKTYWHKHYLSCLHVSVIFLKKDYGYQLCRNEMFFLGEKQKQEQNKTTIKQNTTGNKICSKFGKLVLIWTSILLPIEKYLYFCSSRKPMLGCENTHWYVYSRFLPLGYSQPELDSLL